MSLQREAAQMQSRWFPRKLFVSGQKEKRPVVHGALPGVEVAGVVPTTQPIGGLVLLENVQRYRDLMAQ
jgi:hypothetical protein